MIHHQTWHTHTKFKLGVFFSQLFFISDRRFLMISLPTTSKKYPKRLKKIVLSKKKVYDWLIVEYYLRPTDHKISSLSHYKSTKKSLNAMTHAYRLFKTTFAAALSSLAPLPHTIDHCCHYFTTKEENSMMSPFRRLTTLQYYDNDYAMWHWCYYFRAGQQAKRTYPIQFDSFSFQM